MPSPASKVSAPWTPLRNPRPRLPRRMGMVLLGLASALFPLAPAQALEEIVVQIPLIDTGFT